MPELPEVETIVRDLAQTIAGKSIARVNVRLPKIAVAAPGVHFTRELRGQRIESVARRGKFTVIALSSGRRLVVSFWLGLNFTSKGAVPWDFTVDDLKFIK